jgi:hypothetical protein
VPDADDPTHDGIRKNVLWANLMVRAVMLDEHAYRYEEILPCVSVGDFFRREVLVQSATLATHSKNSDLTLQDFRSRDNM